MKESTSAFFEEEKKEVDEKKPIFSCRIHLFEDGSTAIEPDGFEYSESKAYQTISEIKSWIQAERAARMLAQAVLATPENEQNSKQS